MDEWKISHLAEEDQMDEENKWIELWPKQKVDGWHGLDRSYEVATWCLPSGQLILLSLPSQKFFQCFGQTLVSVSFRNFLFLAKVVIINQAFWWRVFMVLWNLFWIKSILSQNSMFNREIAKKRKKNLQLPSIWKVLKIFLLSYFEYWLIWLDINTFGLIATWATSLNWKKIKILIGICRKRGDHPYEDDEDLAKSGHKPNMK